MSPKDGWRMPSRLSVIYVMGAGRSGSTVLGVTLGNCEGVFYAGELEAWLRRSGAPNFSGTERMGFWSAVRDEVGGEDLFGNSSWRHLEYSMAPLAGSPLRRRRLRRRYRKVTGGLYRAIAANANATHVVDTSHYPLRARELRRIGDIDLYLLYLVRDARDVVASFGRRDVSNRSKSSLAANAYLFLTHLLSVAVFLSHRRDKRALLHYEDFIAQPETTIARILDWAQADASIPDLARLDTGVAFQGNRLLDSTHIALKRKAREMASGSHRTSLTHLLQLPWTLALYRLSPNMGRTAAQSGQAGAATAAAAAGQTAQAGQMAESPR
jgi:Sulfotransferase family